MAAGATKIMRDLVETAKIHALVAPWRHAGHDALHRVMRELPYGFPKIMVSTMASGNVAPWVGTSDITMMYLRDRHHGPQPIHAPHPRQCGRRSLRHGGGGARRPEMAPLVAITTVGITTEGAMSAARVLEDAGYETIIFHAVGTGGQAMEEMMEQGLIGAVLDYSTIEVSNDMHQGFARRRRRDRLTVAGRLGLPQVICPGAIEVLVFNEPETVPENATKAVGLSVTAPRSPTCGSTREEMDAVGRRDR